MHRPLPRSLRSVAPLALALCAGFAVAGPQSIDPNIGLRYATFDPAMGEPAVPSQLAANAQSTVLLVQLNTLSTDEIRSAITAVGGDIVRYVPDHVHIVRATPQARAAIEAMPFVRWTGFYHPAYRLDDAATKFILFPQENALAQRWSIEVFRDDNTDLPALAGKIRAMGGTVHFEPSNEFRFEATLTPTQLQQVASMNEVSFIDAWGPGGWDMDIIRNVAGTNYVQTGSLLFDGTGVRGEIFDTETPATNPEWNTATGGNGVIYHGTNGNSGTHGSSCFGICFARGISPQHKGHMPKGQGIFCWYTQSTSFGGTITRLQLAQQSVDPAGNFRSVFQTSSVGNPQIPNYSTLSAEMDNVTFQTDYLHCQSQSNTGNQNSRPEAWGKNMVSGGAYQHNNSSNILAWVGSGASRGPATDGRIKPDIAGVYDNIATTSATGYTSGFGGTSGGTPIVCGATGIFFQMWHEGVWSGFGGGASVFDSAPGITTAKAAMINTANRPSTISAAFNRYRHAWGFPDLKNLYDSRNITFIVNESDPINQGQTIEYTIEVQSGQPQLDITMCYIDPQGTVGAAKHRINDLSLRVTSPGGTVYTGNVGLIDTNFSTPSTTLNDYDTVENVFINAPAAGDWKVEVVGSIVVADTVPGTPGTNARFSLWVNGGLEASGCYADCDGNGTLNVFDYICFGNAYSSSQAYADCDGNGSFNVFDYICYGNAYSAGCP